MEHIKWNYSLCQKMGICKCIRITLLFTNSHMTDSMNILGTRILQEFGAYLHTKCTYCILPFYQAGHREIPQKEEEKNITLLWHSHFVLGSFHKKNKREKTIMGKLAIFTLHCIQWIGRSFDQNSPNWTHISSTDEVFFCALSFPLCSEWVLLDLIAIEQK